MRAVDKFEYRAHKERGGAEILAVCFVLCARAALFVAMCLFEAWRCVVGIIKKDTVSGLDGKLGRLASGVEGLHELPMDATCWDDQEAHF